MAHKLLPTRVFADPEGFMTVMRAPHARGWLRRLWARAFEDSRTDQPPLAAEGLDVTITEIAGCDCAVITFPPARQSPDAVAAAAVHDQDGWRYLVLERLGTDDARAVLCEWFADGSRQNHGRTAGTVDRQADLSEFLETVKAQLENESSEQLWHRVGGAAWNPSDSDHPLDLAATTRPFRLRPCVFAYCALPAAISADAEALASDDERTRADVIHRLWADADPAELDEGGSQPQLSSTIVTVLDEDYLVIDLPDPTAPPEPRYVALRIEADPARRCVTPVYTLELAQADWEATGLLAFVDQDLSHSIRGFLPDLELDTFLGAIAGEIRPDTNRDTLSQLMLYPRISATSWADDDD
jgi:hypothetical protein